MIEAENYADFLNWIMGEYTPISDDRYKCMFDGNVYTAKDVAAHYLSVDNEPDF